MICSSCIAEAIHWSQPSHKAEKLLSWKFGVSSFCFCKVILKTSSVTAWLQCLCCQVTIYRLFVDILPRYDLFWWLVPENIVFFLQLSGSKYRYLGQNIGVKTAFFHLSVWLIGQGEWKFSRRHGFDSHRFIAYAEKCHWAENCKFCKFFIF